MFKKSRHSSSSISIITRKTTKFQRELFVLMQISTTFINQTVSEMYKNFIKKKQAWI